MSLDDCGGKRLGGSDVSRIQVQGKEMFKKINQIKLVSHLPFSPEGNDTVFVGMVSEFTFPFSNVSFSVCCNCQLRPNRCIAGGKEYILFKGFGAFNCNVK